MTKTDAHLTTGRIGEDTAAAFLQRRGWRIIARNWRCAQGELDIIARDPDGVLVVCEVECRKGRGCGDPREAMAYGRVRRLRALVAEWMRCQESPVGRVRLDAIGVLTRHDGTSSITHVVGIDA